MSAALKNAEALLAAGRTREAAETVRAHLRRARADAHAWKLLARLHSEAGEHEQSRACLERAGACGDPEAWYLLGHDFSRAGRWREAADAFQKSHALRPVEPVALGGLGECLLSMGDEAGALAAYERAVTLAPAHPDAYRQLAAALVKLGRAGDAAGTAMRGLARCGDDPLLLQQAVYALNVSDDADEDALSALHRRLAMAVGGGRSPRETSSFPNAPDPDRRLRVAFLSCDFKEHSCAYFLEGPLGSLGGADLELFLYSTTPEEDEFTPRFRKVGAWRDCRAMSAEDLADLALRDAIDVVVDLTGWTAAGHMRALAPRIAPVQATYLGYPNTTGLPSMDVRLVDSITDPPGAEVFCSERLLRLDPCFLCFRPGEGWPEPAETENLRDASAPVVFGSFNNAMKISGATLEAWARILDRLPHAGLALKGHGMTPPIEARLRAAFARAGGADRVRVLPFTPTTREHLLQYARVDVALDTFPYNGTTTTCEALWMGVPVVTVRGVSHRARVGASLLSAVGAQAWVAESVPGYVDAACALATDRGARGGWRRTLRGRVAASALRDETGLARRLEGALREAWRGWCGRRGSAPGP